MELLSQVIDVLSRALGDEHPMTIGSKRNMAETWQMVARKYSNKLEWFENAEALFLEILPVSEKVYGREVRATGCEERSDEVLRIVCLLVASIWDGVSDSNISSSRLSRRSVSRSLRPRAVARGALLRGHEGQDEDAGVRQVAPVCGAEGKGSRDHGQVRGAEAAPDELEEVVERG